MEYEVGQIVYSKNGRDKGKTMMVVSVEDKHVYLCNGKMRRVEKPKRKKTIHIQPTKHVDAQMADMFIQGELILDAQIRKAIKAYENKQ